jgi:hypothetical protein
MTLIFRNFERFQIKIIDSDIRFILELVRKVFILVRVQARYQTFEV